MTDSKRMIVQTTVLYIQSGVKRAWPTKGLPDISVPPP